MKKILILCTALIGLIFNVQAQDAQLCELPPSLDQLKSKAVEVADITLDGNLLKLAANMIDKNKPDEAEAQKILSDIKSICVRSYKFDQSARYEETDIEKLRSQFKNPTWSSMVRVRNQRNGENVDVLFKTEDGAFSGIAVIVAKPEEFTFVRIDGAIDLAELAKLGGQFGVPKLDLQGQPEKAPE